MEKKEALTNQEFTNLVMGFKGQYPEKELKKFINYFVNRKHFSTFTKFDIKRRLTTWFSPSRKESFKKRYKDVKVEDIRLQALKNTLGTVDPLR